MFVAHPDDEVIFGWPVLRRAKRIVALVSDEDNADRCWCGRRREALERVGDLVGAEVICLNGDSEFYRWDTRSRALLGFLEGALQALDATEPECVFTHNPWGEYGNIDHILTHLAARSFYSTILTTDISIQANWIPVPAWSPGTLIEKPEFDAELYGQCEEIYRSCECWTWSWPPVMEVGLYEMNVL